MKAVKFILKSLIVFFGIIYLMYVSYVYFNQEEMVFMASKLPKDYRFEFQQDFEEINIPSFDNNKLNGLLFKVPNPKGLVFYLHGNANSLNSWGAIANVYTSLGYDIFILDYRGYGKSEGKIVSQDQFLKDVTYAYKKLATRYDEDKIVVTGYSIGTGAAAYLAANEHPKMLVLQAPYYNFLEFSSAKAPFIPDFLKKFTFETNQYIKNVKLPVYIFHGNQDHLIGLENSERLKKLLKPTDSLFVLKGQGHLGINDNADFRAKLKQILNQ
ncbi:MAG: alpha/beta fold hydrolase [Flavobacterium sp.]